MSPWPKAFSTPRSRPRPPSSATTPRRSTSSPADPSKGLGRGEHCPRHEIGSEGGEDGEVEQAGGRHHRGVRTLPQRETGDDDEDDGADRAGQPEPAEHAVVAVIDRAADNL